MKTRSFLVLFGTYTSALLYRLDWTQGLTFEGTVVPAVLFMTFALYMATLTISGWMQEAQL
jgi:hypothetical protein